MLYGSLFNFFDVGGRGSRRVAFTLDLTSGSGFAAASSSEGFCLSYVTTRRLVEVHKRFHPED